jgi:hypothetical protein
MIPPRIPVHNTSTLQCGSPNIAATRAASMWSFSQLDQMHNTTHGTDNDKNPRKNVLPAPTGFANETATIISSIHHQGIANKCNKTATQHNKSIIQLIFKSDG